MIDHIHCIICGKPAFIDQDDFEPNRAPIGYLCTTCEHCFDSHYLINRVQCFKSGIFKDEFNLLESRLSCSTYSCDEDPDDGAVSFYIF